MKRSGVLRRRLGGIDARLSGGHRGCLLNASPASQREIPRFTASSCSGPGTGHLRKWVRSGQYKRQLVFEMGGYVENRSVMLKMDW